MRRRDGMPLPGARMQHASKPAGAGGKQATASVPGVPRRLLPNEPRIQNSSAQQALTQLHLLPALPALQAFFLAVRAQVDPALRQHKPAKQGKPYPLGQCLEITLAAEQCLSRLPADAFTGEAAAGQRAYTAFRKAGGTFRQVWGDLRGCFFQNAFQLGTLYVDVSNDTVTPTKPKVEILPFDQAGLSAVDDFPHFARLAQRYWNDDVYPNHAAPELAPYFPLLHVDQDGIVKLCEPTDYMIALALAGRFQPSETVLSGNAMPDAVHAAVSAVLQRAGCNTADTAAEGRRQALRQCRHARERRWHADHRQTALAVEMVRSVNQQLAQMPIVALRQPQNAASMADSLKKHQNETAMSQSPAATPQTVHIDGVAYLLSDFSPQARQHLEMLLAADERIRGLQREQDMIRTARTAYLAALKTQLPPPLPQD